MKKTIRKMIALFALTAVVLLALGCASADFSLLGEEQHLVILHTNDHHGHPVAFFNYPAEGQGGLPARATLVDRIRSQEENVLLLDAGDFNTGRPESNFFKAEPDILGYNYIGYDAVTIGNHEFDNPKWVMQKQILMSEFPWLCANVERTDGTAIPNVKPYIIKEMGGLKVAILGLVSKTTAGTGAPRNIKGLVFRDEVEVAYRLVPELQKKADVVIALVHLGLYDDETTGSRRLAASVPGIDLVVDGHSHSRPSESLVVKNRITGYDVPIVQAYKWGLFLGRVDLTIRNGEVIDYEYGAIPVNQKSKKNTDGVITYPFIGAEIREDLRLAAMMEPYVAEVTNILDEVVGQADQPFLNDDTRKRETPLGNLVADSMLWYVREKLGVQADLAIQNGGGIRTSIDAGKIKRGTIYEVLPFDNSVAVVTMTGRQLEGIFDYIGTTVGEGAYAQVAGVSYTIQTASKKVRDILIDGEPLDPSREYKVVTNSYLASGGDHYAGFKEASDVYDASIMQRDALIEYITFLGGSIAPTDEVRILHK